MADEKPSFRISYLYKEKNIYTSSNEFALRYLICFNKVKCNRYDVLLKIFK